MAIDSTIYFLTADIESTSQKAASLGAQLIMPKTEVPNVGLVSVLKDPAGAHFYLWQPSRQDG